jgi:biotin carboxylase
MILGGNYVQAEATKAAKQLGYYTISTDLHEGNPGHRIADEYCKVDIIDNEAVLKEARRLEIDGIVPFCSDVLAPVAAYVQEKMGLPGNPYDVVHTMTHKDLFRKFMQREGFLTPHNVKVSSIEEAISVFENTKQKLMLKPTDSAGSKGVFAIESVNDIEIYWNKTISVSPSAGDIHSPLLSKSASSSNSKMLSATVPLFHPLPVITPDSRFLPLLCTPFTSAMMPSVLTINVATSRTEPSVST